MATQEQCTKVEKEIEKAIDYLRWAKTEIYFNGNDKTDWDDVQQNIFKAELQIDTINGLIP